MNPKLLLCFALVLSGGLFGCSTAHHQLSGLPIRSHNPQCGLTFYLPASWQGYLVLTQQCEGETYLPKDDKDVVLERGSVIEQGTYDELVAINGAFASLLKSQQARE